MNRDKLFILVLILAGISSCESGMNAIEYDRKITQELIDELFQKENLLKQNCVLEYSKWQLSTKEELLLFIAENFKIKNKDFLNFQIDLFKQFRITPELVSSKKIIKNQEYREFVEVTSLIKKNNFAYLDWLKEKKCDNGFSSISKPIFNESYDLALVHVEEICGPLCGRKTIIICEHKNKKWTLKTILDSWVQ